MVKWQQNLIELPVRAWSQAGDPLSRTFDVHLSADGLNILAGSAVIVSLPKNETKMATLVPRDSLILRENETYILTVNENDEAQKVNVLVGQGVGEWVSVSGDLNAGDEVIIRGGERLQAGQKIRRHRDLVAKVN
jgi:multidrug efflux pump subunit AcrA (membrane-fusion protein)